MMLLKGLIGLFLMLMMIIRDTDGNSCTSSANNVQICKAFSTHCCPYQSFSRSYYGTTFSTCCHDMRYTTSKRYCTNDIAARMYCPYPSSHCCPKATYMSGSWRQGCCSASSAIPHRTPWSCQAGPSSYATCNYYGSSYCCPHVSYAYSHQNTTFSTCCGKWDLRSSTTTCSNPSETFWCRTPYASCCSRTIFHVSRKAWETRNSCCYSSSAYPTREYGNNNNNSKVAAIIGGVIGALILVIIITVPVAVHCSRHKAARSRRVDGMNATNVANQRALPYNHQQQMPMGYMYAGGGVTPVPLGAGYPPVGHALVPPGYIQSNAMYQPAAHTPVPVVTTGFAQPALSPAALPGVAQAAPVNMVDQPEPVPEKTALP